MKQKNIAEAETRLKQSQDGFAAYMKRTVRTPADEALDGDLKARYDAIAGMQPMLKYAKTACLKPSINHENETARPLDDAYNAVLLKAIKIRTRTRQRADGTGSHPHPAGADVYVRRVWPGAGAGGDHPLWCCAVR